MLSSTIGDNKMDKGNGDIGERFDISPKDARLNSWGSSTISCSLISDQYMSYLASSDLMFGFSGGDVSVLATGYNDLGTSHGKGVMNPKVHDSHTTTVDGVIRDSRERGTDGCNEVVIRRCVAGKKITPSYIIAHCKSVDKIPDICKKAASEFGVPIVMIDDSAYDDRQPEGKFIRQKDRLH